MTIFITIWCFLGLLSGIYLKKEVLSTLKKEVKLWKKILYFICSAIFGIFWIGIASEKFLFGSGQIEM